MPFASPKQIVAKSKNAYPRFLKQWICGEDDSFFPHSLRVKLAADPQNIPGTIAASQELLSHSKAVRKWGYTVHTEEIRTRDFGKNRFPKSITIDTRDDLLRLAKKVNEFAATCRVVQRVRDELPQLEAWLLKHVLTLHRHAESVDGLIGVAKYFIDHPWPDCFLRQIPVPVDTKFIEFHASVLRQWLDELLPESAYDASEIKFARRYGLRDGQPHQALRLLDPQLQRAIGLPFEELSLPLRTIATLPVEEATALIVENDMNLFILPPFPRGIGLHGKGNAVILLERLKWLKTNRIFYWGDIDVDGLLILSRLRNLFSHVESLMMDRETMRSNEAYAGTGNGTTPTAPTNLTPGEQAAFEFCSQHNRRLEQEKIPLAFVDRTFAALAAG